MTESNTKQIKGVGGGGRLHLHFNVSTFELEAAKMHPFPQESLTQGHLEAWQTQVYSIYSCTCSTSEICCVFFFLRQTGFLVMCSNIPLLMPRKCTADTPAVHSSLCWPIRKEENTAFSPVWGLKEHTSAIVPSAPHCFKLGLHIHSPPDTTTVLCCWPLSSSSGVIED